MNNVKKTIGWCDYTWNPITGCKAGCFYCYARKLFNRFHRSFKPEFHQERLNEIDKLKKPCKVFVCSVSDLWAPWNRREWNDIVCQTMRKKEYSHLTFQILTRFPEVALYEKLPDNWWVGFTITNKEDIWKIEWVKKIGCGVRFISFEPLLSDMPDLDLKGIDWVIIGELTGSKKTPFDVEWVNEIMRQCLKLNIPVFCKNSLRKYQANLWEKFPQEFPR